MKFKLSTANGLYRLEDVERLSELGFTFHVHGDSAIIDDGNPEIEIDTLDELISFIKKWGQIVMTGDDIIIYDGYLE